VMQCWALTLTCCWAQDALLAADGPRRLVWLLAPGAPPAVLLGALGALRVFCAGAGGPRGDAPACAAPHVAPGAGRDASGVAPARQGCYWAEAGLMAARSNSLGFEARLDALMAAGLLPAAVRLVSEAVDVPGLPGDAGACPAPAAAPAACEAGAASAAAAQAPKATREAIAASALGLLGGLAGCKDMRDALRDAGLMAVLAAVLAPGGAAGAGVRALAVQQAAALSGDAAAAAEFAARGGVAGLMALVRGGAADGNLGVQAAAVLGCLLHHPCVLAAVACAGGGASLLPALRSSCRLALTGALYLLSCLAEFPEARAALAAAAAEPALLALLAASADVSVQAAAVALLRLLARGGAPAAGGTPRAGAAAEGSWQRPGGRGRSFDSARGQRCGLAAFEAPVPRLRRTRSLC